MLGKVLVGGGLRMVSCGKCGSDLEPDGSCRACLDDARSNLFYAKDAVDGRVKADIVTLRLNEIERRLLEDVKSVLDIAGDGTAIKFVMDAGWNVLLSGFGKDNLVWLCDRNRARRLIGSGKKRG